jgi:transcriptional regulator with XRE-family HTH domain
MVAKKSALGVAFGALIKAARKSKGVSQEKLAELAGCTPVFVSNIETGRHLPNIKLAVDIEKALGLSPGILINKAADIVARAERKRSAS